MGQRFPERIGIGEGWQAQVGATDFGGCVGIGTGGAMKPGVSNNISCLIVGLAIPATSVKDFKRVYMRKERF
jgi:hypothetical protein